MNATYRFTRNLAMYACVALSVFGFATTWAGCGDGIIGVGEFCDNGMRNGTPVSFTTNAGCNSDCSIRVGCFKSFNPYNNTIREYPMEGNCSAGGAVECTATSTCPSFAANGDCKEFWSLNLGIACCAGGGWPDINGNCPSGGGSSYKYRKCSVPAGNQRYAYGPLGLDNEACSSPSGAGNYSNDQFICVSTSYGSSAAVIAAGFGCGTSTPPSSCGGFIPTNASACNNTAPGSATNWDIVSDCTNAGACKYQCVSPAVPSGTTCVVENFTQYVCQSNGNRQANASLSSCSNYWDAGGSYNSSSSPVCRGSAAGAPDNNNCADPIEPVSCGAAYGSCTNASATNMVDNGCGNTKTWTCGSAGTCTINNPACPLNCPNAACDNGETCTTCPNDCGTCTENGLCNNSSPGDCSAGSSSNPSLTAACNATVGWTCYGSNAGSTADDDVCSYTNSSCTAINGACGGSNFTCNAGTYQYLNASQWRCNGINGGTNATCNLSGPPPVCGDGVVNQTHEQCEGSTTASNPTRSCNPGSCLWSYTRTCACTSVSTRQCDIDSNGNVDGVNNSNPGYCCAGSSPNALRTNAPASAAPGSPSASTANGHYCDGQILRWQDYDGNSCGTAPQSLDCRTFGIGIEYTCNVAAKNCIPDPKLMMEAHRCLLTGAAHTLANCTAQLASYGGTNAARCPLHPVINQPDCNKSVFDNELGNIYNASGGLIQGDVPKTSSSQSAYVQFRNLTPSTTYHVRPSPNMLPPGWVLITGGTTFTTSPTLQGLDTWRGITRGLSSVISDALRVSFGSETVGTSKFFYYCATGSCPTVRKLNVAVVHDRDNNGFQSYHDHERGLPGATVRLYSVCKKTI